MKIAKLQDISQPGFLFFYYYYFLNVDGPCESVTASDASGAVMVWRLRFLILNFPFTEVFFFLEEGNF